MKTNRAMIYKQKAAQYAHDLVTAPPWGNPIQRLKTVAEVVKYWSDMINYVWKEGDGIGPDALTCLKANFSKTYEAGYRQCMEDQKNGINGQDRLPPGTPGDIGS